LPDEDEPEKEHHKQSGHDNEVHGLSLI
jgi:hypothetical protein